MKKTSLKQDNKIDTLGGLDIYSHQLAEILNRQASILITDTKGAVVAANDYFCKESGYSSEELIGTHHKAFRSDIYSPEYLQEITNTIRSGKTWRGVVQTIRKDGSYYWCQSTVTPLLDKRGIPYQYISVHTNITELKTTQKRLEEQKEDLQLIHDMTGLCNWSIDTTNLIFSASDKVYEIYGIDREHSRDGVSVDLIKAAIHPADKAYMADVDHQIAERGSYDVMHRLLLRDGTVRHVHVVGRAVLDEDGRMVQITGSLQDMTPWVELNDKLSETERRFAVAVECGGHGVWSSNIDQGLIECSPQCKAMLGYADESPHWKIEEWRSLLHPEDVHLVDSAAGKYRRGDTDDYKVQVRMRCANGDYKWIEASGKVVQRDTGGRPVFLMGVNHDISEIKQQQAELTSARNEADKASKAKSDFLSNMSHELRTPLNAIIGFGQLLEIEDSLGSEQAEYAHQIVKAGEHLTVLISEILDLAKVESGRLAVSIDRVQLRSLIDDISPLIRQLAMDKKISVDISQVEDITVLADRTRLKQVLLNLISNAIKYNQEHGQVIVTTSRTDNAKLRITVEDTGHGMSPSQLESIFEPFNRLGAERSSIEGTGIGLTLTKSLVEMMAGTIGVASTVGTGSRFWVEFPIADS